MMKLPHSNLESSRIIYGCMNIGGSWDDSPVGSDAIKNTLELVKTAISNGINFFDHADIYCRGKSEEVFSNIWSELNIKRNDVILQSKCGIRFPGSPNPDSPQRFDFSYDHIMYSVDNILKRLKTDYLDILLLHRPDPLVDPVEVAKAFNKLKESGLVKFFGVSNQNRFQIELLQKFLSIPLIANQLEFNIIHNYLANEGITFNNSQSQMIHGYGTLEYCRLMDIKIQAWSPLAKGSFLNEDNLQNELSKNVYKEIKAIAQQHDVAPEAIATAWILKHPAKMQAVVGTTNPVRLNDICKAESVDLSREEWYRIFNAGRGNKLP